MGGCVDGWIFIDFHQFSSISIDFQWFSSIFIDFGCLERPRPGFSLISINFYWFSLIFIDFHRFSCKVRKLSWFDIYEHVLIEPNEYLVIIRFFISMFNLTFWDVATVLFVIFYCPTSTSKTTYFQHVSDKVPKAKWPHGTSGNAMCLSKSGLFNWICH